MQRENENSDDEEVLERERKKKAAFEDWADTNPKGSGNTKRLWILINAYF